MPHISYSELKDWTTCPHYHKKTWIEKVSSFEGKEYTAFGTAIHDVCEKKLLKEQVDDAKLFKIGFFKKISELLEKNIVINDGNLLSQDFSIFGGIDFNFLPLKTFNTTISVNTPIIETTLQAEVTYYRSMLMVYGGNNTNNPEWEDWHYTDVKGAHSDNYKTIFIDRGNGFEAYEIDSVSWAGTSMHSLNFPYGSGTDEVENSPYPSNFLTAWEDY